MEMDEIFEQEKPKPQEKKEPSLSDYIKAIVKKLAEIDQKIETLKETEKGENFTEIVPKFIDVVKIQTKLETIVRIIDTKDLKSDQKIALIKNLDKEDSTTAGTEKKASVMKKIFG